VTRHPSRDKGGNHGRGGHWIRSTTRARIYQRDGYACVWCRADLRSTIGYGRTLDHVLPRSKGGSNRPENLVTACGTCNHSRQDRAAITFAYDLAYAQDPAPNRRQAATRAALILNRMLDLVCTPLPVLPKTEPECR